MARREHSPYGSRSCLIAFDDVPSAGATGQEATGGWCNPPGTWTMPGTWAGASARWEPTALRGDHPAPRRGIPLPYYYY